MWEDLQHLWDEFSIEMLTNPAGPDQFMFALLIVAIVGGLAFVALKLVFDLIR